MRIAVVSDIHGNLHALEAVRADLRQTAPDLILQGGDVAQGGANPAEVVDRVRDLGWPGVFGNADELLFRPESLDEFARQSTQIQPLLPLIRAMGEAACEALGEDRIAWLRGLPLVQRHGQVALVHASPTSGWRSPAPQASDTELESVYGPLGLPIVVFGHVHVPFIRTVSGMTVVNTGSVSLSFDGDRRAAYLLLDDTTPTIRRVEYDVDKELRALATCGFPHSDWIAKTLRAAAPQIP
jgi:putative phosphoesterase